MTEDHERKDETSVVGTHDLPRSIQLADALTQRESETADTIPYTLAELEYKDGLHIVFSYDGASDDYGLAMQGQSGALDRIGKFLFSDFRTPLEAYLAIVPHDIPVPEELLAFQARRKDHGIILDVEKRGIASTCLVVSQLDLTARSSHPEQADLRCTSTYYPWWHWHESATPGLAPASYYSSSFGGKCWKADSYIFNCVPLGSGSWLWARHRMYYKNTKGNYVKQYEEKVPPGAIGHHTVWGLSKRYRRVSYDDGWGSTPNNSNLKYTREGRFPDL